MRPTMIVAPWKSRVNAMQWVDGVMTYREISDMTQHELKTRLHGIDNLVFVDVDEALHLISTTYQVALKRIDVVFLKYISRRLKSLRVLIKIFWELAYKNRIVSRSKLNIAALEKQLSILKRNRVDMGITKTQLSLLWNILRVVSSDRTIIKDNIIYGDRKQLYGLNLIYSIANSMNIRTGVLDNMEPAVVTEVGSFVELEASCSNICNPPQHIEVVPDRFSLTVLTNRMNTHGWRDRVRKHLGRLLQSGDYDNSLFVFMKTYVERRTVRERATSGSKYQYPSTSFYGDHRRQRGHESVVLVGVPPLPGCAFITDDDPDVSRKRCHRMRLYQAMWSAERVYCVGISENYMRDLLGDNNHVHILQKHSRKTSGLV